MSGKVFVDSNVLLYAHDVEAGPKRATAARRLGELWASREGVLSTQVLQEFYVNVTRRIPVPLARGVARSVIRNYALWETREIDAEQVIRASEIEEQHQLSFWDSLILVAAIRSGAATLLSEDFQHGRTIEGVRIENPFVVAAP